jgi:hypothetical protein
MDQGKKGGADNPRLPNVRRENYNGHEIVLRARWSGRV